MFELNLATLPNSILYLEGVQLSYIKVYVHIFNLWYSHNPCFISNAEFAKRTGLHRDTVINAIQFFEKNGILKRVQKGSRRYLVQTSKFLETEAETVDKSTESCTNIARGSELDQGGVGVRPPRGSELDHHNNKINNKKLSKSFCDKNVQEKSKDVDKRNREDWKEANQTKHSWADKAKEPPRADVTKQSTSYDPSKHETPKFDTDSPGYQAFVKSNPYLRRKYEKRKLEETSQATELSTGTPVQSEVPSSQHSSKESSEHVLDGQSYLSPPVRSSNRVMAPSSARSYFEKVGLASEDRVNGDACY